MHRSVDFGTRFLFDVSYDSMSRGQKILIALAIISAVSAVIAVCVATGMETAYPAVSNALTLVSVCNIVTVLCIAYILKHRTQRSSGIYETSFRNSFLGRLGVQTQLRVTEHRETVRSNPLSVLDRLVSAMIGQAHRQERSRMHVTFLGEAGVDTGGLTKDFLDDLFCSLCSVRGLGFDQQESALYLPRAGVEEGEKLAHLRKMGQLMLWCHESYLVGEHLDIKAFETAFSFSAEELDQPFDSLDYDRRLALGFALMDGRESESYQQVCALLARSAWGDRDLEAAVQFLNILDLVPEHLCSDSEPNLDLIKGRDTHRQSIRKALQAYKDSCYMDSLRAIHALAGGMKLLCIKGRNPTAGELNRAWDAHFLGRNAVAFSLCLQGELNRNRIANEIHVVSGTSAVRQKVNWLKEWIREEAAEGELRQMLKFITGLSGYDPNNPLNVHGAIGIGPIPRASTCGNTITIDSGFCSSETGLRDDTKETFINCFKVLVFGRGRYTTT